MEKSFLFRGASISYSIKGKGRVLLLIHGFLGAKEIWNDYQKRLAKNYRVICIDLPGHGNSECIGYVHNMEIIGECLRALLKELDVRKAVIAGHSLGGYVALAFAEQFPDLVLKLLLINTTSRGDKPERQKSRNQLIQLVKENKSRAINLLIPTFFSLKSKKTRHQIKRYIKMANNCSERGIIATVEGMKIRKEREIVLKFAPFPYFFIASKFDEIISYKSSQKEATLNENGNFILLENSSHMSIFEEPEQIFKHLKLLAKRN